jgi:hypothetical protein
VVYDMRGKPAGRQAKPGDRPTHHGPTQTTFLAYSQDTGALGRTAQLRRVHGHPEPNHGFCRWFEQKLKPRLSCRSATSG